MLLLNTLKALQAPITAQVSPLLIMDALPPEIMSCILTYLNEPFQPGSSLLRSSYLSIYSSVSQRWQEAVERRSLLSLQIRTSSLSRLRQMYRPGQEHRPGCTRRIYFTVQLPHVMVDTDDDKARERKALTNNNVFQSSILELVQILCDAAQLNGNLSRQGLFLQIGQEYLPVEPELDGFENGYWQRRDPEAFLHLQDGLYLPRSSLVTGIHIGSSGPFVVDASSSLAIASAFPACTSVSLATDDKESWSRHVRVEQRQRKPAASSK